MKIWEILKKENINKKYRHKPTDFTEMNGLGEYTITESLYLIDEKGTSITFDNTLFHIMQMEFEEIIDWSKVKKDTKVLVSCDGECWSRKYFSNYKNGKIYCFRACGTSWSSLNLCDSIEEWKYCKLAEEE